MNDFKKYIINQNPEFLDEGIIGDTLKKATVVGAMASSLTNTVNAESKVKKPVTTVISKIRIIKVVGVVPIEGSFEQSKILAIRDAKEKAQKQADRIGAKINKGKIIEYRDKGKKAECEMEFTVLN